MTEITAENAGAHHLAWLLYASRGEFRPYKHVARMSKHFMEVLAGRRKNRTIICLPPQHAKSTTVTEALSTFFLGNNPRKRVGICSYNADLAESFGYKTKSMMEEFGKPVFGLELDKARKSKSDWGFDGFPSGGMVSVGLGGSLTGKRLDFLVIDDAFKNAQEAQSAAQRDKVWNWISTVAMTRLSKHAPVITIGTRWHPDDHIGRLLIQTAREGGQKYDLINFPAIATGDEFDEEGKLFRQEGEALCPELHPLERLEEMKSQMSDFQWQALYQQDPTSPEGSFWAPGLFGDEAFFEQWPRNMETLVAALDPSLGHDTRRGDYPACVLLGTAGTGHFFCDSVMKKLPPSRMAVEISLKFIQVKEECGIWPMIFGVEKQGLSELYMEKLDQEFKSRGIPTPIMPVSHEGINKLLRIQRLDPFISHKDLKFRKNLDTGIVVSQLKDFPTGNHDDGPDALEIAFRTLFAACSSA